MSVIQSGLFLIMQRFPQHRTLLRGIYQKNNAFKALCEDYLECSKALDYWRESERNDAPARCREYSHLLQDLEVEVNRSLDAVHDLESSQ
ncbi:MAG: hypothetical protein P8Y96_07270 [Desulfuromonadales bacterium]|jgi:hypothetical protein